VSWKTEPAQGHSRSPILIQIESSYTTFC